MGIYSSRFEEAGKWRVVVKGDWVAAFRHLVGFTTKKKSDALAAIPADFSALPEKLVFEPVASVTPGGLRKVRDLSVPGPTQFQANGFVVHNCDYAGVELRIVTNISREPKWLAEYFRCSNCDFRFDAGNGTFTPKPPPPRCPRCNSDKIGDLHTLTALSVYGEEAQAASDWKLKRQKSKSLNFAMCYGGGPSAATRAVQCDENEGSRIKRQFDSSYSTLAKWWKFQHDFCKKNTYVTTALGRRGYLPDIHHPERFIQSKAQRNATNFPIQGTSADFTKLAMGLIYKEVKKRGWLEKVFMIITMHDELVFEIDFDILEEAIEVIRQLMINNEIIQKLKWPVPLTSDVEIGLDWSVPFDLNAMRMGEVKYKGDKKVKSKEDAVKAGMDWEGLPTFPEFLAPHFQWKTMRQFANSSWGEFTQFSFPEEEEKPSVSSATPSIGTAVVQDKGASKLVTYRLKSPLSGALIQRLVPFLVKWTYKGGASAQLRLLDQHGRPLEGWMPEKLPSFIGDLMDAEGF